MTTGSIFWFVIFAASGGVFVFIGLLMERFSEKDPYKNLSDFRRCKSRKVCGEWFVIGGIVIEIVVGIFSAIDVWETNPLNRPIKTVSAFASILVKGDKYVHFPPTFKDPWYGGVMFIVGTNLNATNVLFRLSATSSDLEMINILGTVAKNRTDREYDITFHQTHPVGDMPRDFGFGKPARSFDGVTSLVLSLPQIETLDDVQFSTNTEVLSGSMEVTVNSSLTWQFDIPPQIQKLRCITSTKIKNSAGKIEIKVLPVSIVDATGRPLGIFDGK